MFLDTFTQRFGTRPGDGCEGPCFPQMQPHTIKLYSWHVLPQARGQNNNEQMNLSLPQFPDSSNHRTQRSWVETPSGVHKPQLHTDLLPC